MWEGSNIFSSTHKENGHSPLSSAQINEDEHLPHACMVALTQQSTRDSLSWRFSWLKTSDNEVWLHDGIETRDKCQYKGDLDNYNGSELLACNNKNACLVTYALID
jgi:hypothetical protein